MLIRLLAIGLAALVIAPAQATAQFDHRPVRYWSFTEDRRGQGEVRVADGSLQGGPLAVRHEFGIAAFEFTGPRDGIAEGEVNASSNGRTFEVYAQSPNLAEPGHAIGGTSHLDHVQSYEKQIDQASIDLQISGAFINAVDANGGNLLPTECPNGIDCVPLVGKVKFTAYAYNAQDEFFRVGGTAYITGHQGHWTINAVTYGSSQQPLWDASDFTIDPDVAGTGSGSRALLSLDDKVDIPIDISSLGVGELFAVHVILDAQAVDHRSRESMVEAFIRDPRRGDDLVQTTGLSPRGEPAFAEPPIEAHAPAECPQGADPAAGTLQFSQPSYVAYESDAGGPLALVTRTGGSTGAASATITTSDDSAESGADYTAVSTTVRFDDGDSSPRLVEIPILPDEPAEEPETFDVSLMDANCAPAGDQSTAEVTIVDENAEPDVPETFTVGGTVSGLEGSGLVLANLGTRLDVAANGAFEFPEPMPDRFPYRVTVAEQPTEPGQVCTVASEAGTISGADVTDVAVECVTPPPVTGLDLGFGADGKVSTAAGGRGQAIAVQPDGMIVTAGGSSDFAVTRHEPDGDPDPTFGGGDGIVTTNLGVSDAAFDVAIDAEDRIVVAGQTSLGTGDFAVARYESDGDLDLTFGGGDGIVVTDFNLGPDSASGVAVQSDGKIVAAGNAGVSRGPGLGFQNDFAVVRYEENGDVDLKVTTELGSDTDLGSDVAIDAQDRIIVGGQVNEGDDFALVRYENDGGVDSSFSGGIVITDFGGREVIKGIAVRPDGRIVVAGYTSSQGTDYDYAVAQYDANGALDLSFGGLGLGLATTDISGRQFGDDFGEDLALDADGGIVVVGRNTSDTSDLVMVRYTEGGNLDGTFGVEGKMVADFFGTGDVGTDVAVQADGKIVAAGYAPEGSTTRFVLARALP